MQRSLIAIILGFLLVGLVVAACGPQESAGTPEEEPATTDAEPADTEEEAPAEEAEAEETTTDEEEAPEEAEEPVDTEAGAATGGSITFWSTETQPERVEATQAILDNFEAESGITVELVQADEDALSQLTTAAVAAGDLPDVIFHPIDFTIGWYEEGILDAEAAASVIDELGADTFAEGPLNLVEVDEGYTAVPSDGWGQLLIYRTDLFEEAGLEPPTSYDLITAAAEQLHNPDESFYGITSASAAGEVFTQQSFEHFALANNCQLVDDAGSATLNSPTCIEAVTAYTNLLGNYGPPGEGTVESTRATYFAGQSAMVIWSPFILDEMAGLRDEAPPTCPECADNPAFLAENSGLVPAFEGPSGAPSQYGQISYMGITTNADTEASIEFLRYWFDEAYLDWLAVSPEGKLPMRSGTADEPTRWVDGWAQLETGVDRKATLGDLYGDEVIQLLVEGANNFQRWGFSQGEGALVTATYQDLPVPLFLRDVLDEVLTPEEAAEEMQLSVEDLQRE
ncbi:MAG: extracellular solute-binding protein [Chloroflexota bacterium]